MHKDKAQSLQRIPREKYKGFKTLGITANPIQFTGITYPYLVWGSAYPYSLWGSTDWIGIQSNSELLCIPIQSVDPHSEYG
jgi:hypothetical protein